MIQLQSIVVKNFKNVYLAELELSPLNVIVGPNGSGKSNLLLITSFLKFIIRGSTDSVEKFFDGDYNLRFSDLFSEKANDCQISLDFRNTESDMIYHYLIELSATSRSRRKFVISREEFTLKQRSNTGPWASIFTRNGKDLHFHSAIKKIIPLVQLADHNSGLRPLTLFQESIDSKFRDAILALNRVLDTQTFYLSPHGMKSVMANQGAFFDGRLASYDLEAEIIELYETDQWAPFINAIRTIVNLDDIEVQSYQNKDGKEHSFVNFLSFGKTDLLHELSDGMVLMIGLILKVVTFNECIIFLEEPENSIHPRALQNFMYFVRQNSAIKQFIITSHSSALLNLVDPSEVFVSHIDSRGLSTISAVQNAKELRTKLNKGFISFGDLLFEDLAEGRDFEDAF
ncbi:AAA family ATPase [Dyadobacter sp. CY312]|uniref:AAA family ATPase n=1 Tax=Dyadobacter sp. CY312 TaxID=2907303 RepID=UPI001F2E99D6|nr:ATP-binding protein [Dyadobacter sp. CY312]MCE7041739.1 AAA family ATPase [Dyadobacter sp. CY312]